MICPICQKRKAKRFCPAKAQTICAVCCGTEREVTIDCPFDCPYLVASRNYDYERRELHRDEMPFADVNVETSFVMNHEKLLSAIAYAILTYANSNRAVDADVIAALRSLAESYRTLASGIYYEQPPVYAAQRAIYETLKRAIEQYRNEETRYAGVSVRDGDIRDMLIFLTQMGALRSNGRPKGRAFLDFLRAGFEFESLPQSSTSNLVIP